MEKFEHTPKLFTEADQKFFDEIIPGATIVTYKDPVTGNFSDYSVTRKDTVTGKIFITPTDVAPHLAHEISTTLGEILSYKVTKE